LLQPARPVIRKLDEPMKARTSQPPRGRIARSSVRGIAQGEALVTAGTQSSPSSHVPVQFSAQSPRVHLGAGVVAAGPLIAATAASAASARALSPGVPLPFGVRATSSAPVATAPLMPARALSPVAWRPCSPVRAVSPIRDRAQVRACSPVMMPQRRPPQAACGSVVVGMGAPRLRSPSPACGAIAKGAAMAYSGASSIPINESVFCTTTVPSGSLPAWLVDVKPARASLVVQPVCTTMSMPPSTARSLTFDPPK